ncbi:MAG TPA: Hsp20/alpha crystallin family protein [Campylobacterales bacterium]|nr:Hsp20/alpha crystallin family protein [Campylobacterales bacterium]
MFKKIIITTLLAFVPIVSIQADNNISKGPFANDPLFKDFQKLQTDMNKVFENFHKQFFSDMSIPKIPANLDSGFSISFKTDVVDKGDHYEVKADLPGVDQKAINVKVKDNILSIEAKTQKSKEDKKGDKIIKQERFIGNFYRAMSLPNDANADKMTTDYKNGVLTVTIPKKK